MKHHRWFGKPAHKRHPLLTPFLFLLSVHILIITSDRIANASLEHPNQTNQKVDIQEGHKQAENPLQIRIYWKDGLHLDGRFNRLRFVLGGSAMLDAGQLSADDETKQAFSDFEQNSGNFRRLRVHSLTTLSDLVEFRLDVDFANAREIKDNWFRIMKIPAIEHIRFGHLKEPFSLEGLTSSQVNLFMEEALPTMAFGPGRNIGARYNNHFFNEQLIVWGGAFWNTGSYSNVGNTRDQLSESLGLSSTIRVSTSKRFVSDRNGLVHIGLSHRYLAQRDKKPIRLDARPESFLTDVRLVDTGEFQITDGHQIAPEFALVYGPYSIQAEYFNTHLQAEADLSFSGFYLSSSWFLTGESRNYKREEGIFNPPILKRKFNPKEGGWGAFELSLRYSFVDLNDQNINGGEATSITAGLNWYLFPRIRLLFNYINAQVKNRLSPRIESGYSDIFMLRLQKGF